ncbi:MAG: GLPGLI family protein [Bacteroidales bacterium]|nr:GLPGLI family protein [Bacteroidales bacterium]
MKRLITPITLCLVVIAASAQQKADIEVSYTEYQPNMRTGKIGDVTHNYILLANAGESKFYSPRTEYIDSLNSTPDGKAKYQEMTRTAYLGGKWDEIPSADGRYYVVKSGADNKFIYYDKAGTERFFYEEDIPEHKWEVSDSTKNILGYECFKATTDFHGRKWTVWFTPEIPVVAGPWKLEGVPGLILEADADGGQYRFEAKGIQQTNRTIGPIYLANEYEKTDRIRFLKANRSFNDNPIGSINAQLGGKGISIGPVKDENGEDVSDRLFVPRETVDFIETDY